MEVLGPSTQGFGSVLVPSVSYPAYLGPDSLRVPGLYLGGPVEDGRGHCLRLRTSVLRGSLSEWWGVLTLGRPPAVVGGKELEKILNEGKDTTQEMECLLTKTTHSEMTPFPITTR